MPDREKNCQKRILKILDYAKDGLEFLKKSDETDFQKKIEESGIQFVTSQEIIPYTGRSPKTCGDGFAACTPQNQTRRYSRIS